MPIISRFLQILLFATIAATPAKADWRQDIGTFRIGIVAGDDVQGTYARVEPFRLALAEALGLNVEIFAAKNYRILINAHVAARIEYAIYSATAYATAWKMCECVEPLVLPKSLSGENNYKSIIIAADGGPQNLDQLVGAKLTGLSANSFAGYKFAAFELAAAAVKLPDDIQFAPSGEQAVQQYLAGDYNALIGWSSLSGDPQAGYSLGTLKLIAELNGKNKADRSQAGLAAPNPVIGRVIWQSSAIPHRPHAIRKTLAAEAKTLLRVVLTRMYETDPVAYDSIEPVFGGGFAAASHSQFLPIIAYVNSLAPLKKDAEAVPSLPESE